MKALPRLGLVAAALVLAAPSADSGNDLAQLYRAYADATGAFLIRGLAPGMIELRADPPAIPGRPPRAASAEPVTIRLRPGAVATAELRLAPVD